MGRAFYRFTSRIKNAFKRLVLPSTYFESLGIDYLGPIDGHDIVELDKTLKRPKITTYHLSTLFYHQRKRLFLC